jgi:predicted DsbA family dithiol-disulfide isomerase
MKTTLSTTEAAHRLMDDNNANWSYAGAYALVEYLEELEEDIGEEIEFCPVSLRCDFSQYESLDAWATEQWGNDRDFDEALNDMTEQQASDEAIRSYIQDHGTLIEFDGGIIVSSF